MGSILEDSRNGRTALHAVGRPN